jgi:hypothetical protein
MQASRRPFSGHSSPGTPAVYDEIHPALAFTADERPQRLCRPRGMLPVSLITVRYNSRW